MSDPSSARGSTRRTGRVLWGLAMTAAGAACAARLLSPLAQSSANSEATAVIRERRTIGAGEDVAAAIDETARRILAPDALSAALRQSGENLAPDETLTAEAEALRGRLRVDVSPGVDRQPWTISIHCAAPGDAAAVNALAEEYVRRQQASAADEQFEAYRAAHAATERARKAAEQAKSELDRQIDRLVRWSVENCSRPAAPAAAVASAPSEPKHSDDGAPQQLAEFKRRVAVLEAQRAALLERLLPAHPDVQSLDSELAAARSELNAAQAELPAPPAIPPTTIAPAASPKATNASPSDIACSDDATAKALADLAAQRKTFSRALARCAQLAIAERRQAQQAIARQQGANASITPAVITAGKYRATAWQSITLIGLFGMLVGGMLARPQQPSPEVFSNGDELEAALGVPLLGVLDI